MSTSTHCIASVVNADTKIELSCHGNMRWPVWISRRRAIKSVFIVTAVLLAAYMLSLHLGGCAAPVHGLWPPESNEDRFKVIVFADGLHSEIGIWSDDDPEGQELDRLVSWSYGEEKYYLERKRGVCGKLRATLLPTVGVVRVHRAGGRFRDSQDLPEAIWTFCVSREGHNRLLAHVRAERASTAAVSTTEYSDWYPAKRSYHALHNCHHWTARALRETGLPIWSSHALFRWSLERQLDRAEKMMGNFVRQ